MSKHKMIWAPLVVAAMLFFTAMPGHAITIGINAEITAVNNAGYPTNPFSVNVGDIFAWALTYNEAAVSPTGLDLETITDLSGPVGNFTFVEQQDIDFAIGWPKLILINQNPVGIDFTTGLMFYAGISSVQLTTLPDPLAVPRYNTFSIFDTSTPGTSVVMVEGKFQGLPGVPEPATMLLLGSGLVGLIAVRRKLKKA